MIRFYLGEDPLLHNVPTWQCRKPKELAHVLAHLPELVVKETQGSGGYGMLVGPAASREEIELFRERLKARPEAYIAQPTLSLSTCPTFVESGVAPRHIDLRPFVLSAPDRVRLVPGGLTRVALREGSLVVNSSQGGGTGHLGGGGISMLSRTASDLYWMSRYLERAENLARMLDVSYSLSLLPQDRNGGGLDELAMPLLITGTLDAYLERHGELAAERLLSFFALDPDNPASIYSCLAAARASAHAVRGRITLDMWENINATWLEMRGIAAEGILRYGISRFCEWVKDRSHLFRGATFATSMRNDAFRFIRLGTFIERADNTLRLLDARYQTQGEAALAGRTRHRARLLPVERAAAGAIRLRGLHRAVPRLAQRAQHRRIAAVARGRAAFAAVLHRGTERDPFRPAGVNGRPARAWPPSWRRGCATPASTRCWSRACIPGSPTTSCWFASWPTPFTAPTWRPHETLDHPRHHLSLRRPGARQHPVPAPDPAGQRAPARGRLAPGPAAPGARCAIRTATSCMS